MAVISIVVCCGRNTSVGLEFSEEKIFLLHVFPTKEGAVNEHTHGTDVLASDFRPVKSDVAQDLHVKVETTGVDHREAKGHLEVLGALIDVSEKPSQPEILFEAVALRNCVPVAQVRHELLVLPILLSDTLKEAQRVRVRVRMRVFVWVERQVRTIEHGCVLLGLAFPADEVLEESCRFL